MNNNTRNSILAGALAGMTGGLVMMMMRKRMVPKIMPQPMQPDEFVPQEVIKWTETQVGHPQALSDGQEMKAAAGAHLGYSALMGTLYGLARPLMQTVPTPLAGAAFGLGVWALSFEGWMPALGIIERTTDKPAQKWLVPIMGHMVYGAVTALAFEALTSTNRREASERMAMTEESPDYTERTAVVNGIRMRWLEYGEGQPVVLVHGIPTSPELWRKVIPRLKDARVLAWEMVGYGKSIPEGRGRDISVAQQAEYLAAWLRHLGIKQAVLGGHDLGGGVVQNVAVRYPELCAGLFLTNAIGYDNWPVSLVKALRAAGGVVRNLPDPVIKVIHGLFLRLGHDNGRVAAASLPVHVRNYLQHNATEAFIRQARSLDVRDTLAVQNALPHLEVPARVVWGAADQFLEVRYGERFARDLGTTLRRIEGGKHFTPEDHPVEVSQALNDIIQEVWNRADAVGV
jgi:pimeloyl-ACP methyl ester carboxylesterase/uncharacterized membrane protein YagU involved in acid resistance